MNKSSVITDSSKYFGLLLACLLAGCASTPSESALRVKVAEATEVSLCKFITNVEGSSPLGNLAYAKGIRNAKIEALEKAAAAGATHVVWTDVEGFMGSSVNGEAYRCE